jgi:hypothetical protein
MPVLRRAIPLILAAGVMAATLFAPAAGAQPVAQATTKAFGPGGKTLRVRLVVDRFVARDGRIAAVGTAGAVLVDPVTGQRVRQSQHVTFAVRRGASCSILQLTLDKLDLTLLGLNVHLDKVKLDVTGQRSGGVLGRLFCSLAASRVKAASAARSLNRGLRRAPLAPMAFTTRVRPIASAAQGTCPVLALTLGPLHLELLGLVVDLNEVNLRITAIPGGGVLGNLFCGLSRPTA